MNFMWEDYCTAQSGAVERLFDREALRFIGCDDGFRPFYDYWMEELGPDQFWSKVLFQQGEIIAVIAFAKSPDGVFTIQEIVVAPEKRGCGYGLAALEELLRCGAEIFGQEIHLAEAVIFPSNLASRRMFEKAGFIHVEARSDEGGLFYQFRNRVGLDLTEKCDL